MYLVFHTVQTTDILDILLLMMRRSYFGLFFFWALCFKEQPSSSPRLCELTPCLFFFFLPLSFVLSITLFICPFLLMFSCYCYFSFFRCAGVVDVDCPVFPSISLVCPICGGGDSDVTYEFDEAVRADFGDAVCMR